MNFQLNIDPKSGDPFIEFTVNNAKNNSLESKVLQRFIELSNKNGILLSEGVPNFMGYGVKYKIEIDR